MKIAVIFIEATTYNDASIRKVYSGLGHEFRGIFLSKSKSSHDFGEPGGDLDCCTILEGGIGQKLFRLLSILRNGRYGLVVVNGYSGILELAAIQFCIITRTPFAIESDTQYTPVHNPIKAFAKRILLGLIFKKASGFAGGSRQTELFRRYGMPEERIHVMPMTVDVELFSSETQKLRKSRDELKARLGIPDEIVILYVGRLEECKGLDILCDAFVRIRSTRRDLSLVLVGRGEMERKLKEKYPLDGIMFAGYAKLPKLFEYYAVADIFVLPSSFEPWGLVINEAMASGLPVIVSDEVGATDDLIIHRQNGLVFKSCSAEGLFQCMKQLADNPVLRRKMGHESERIICGWNFDEYKERLMDFITQKDKE